MCKVVTWEGMHVSALRSQTVSNDVCWVLTLFLYSSATSVRYYKEKKEDCQLSYYFFCLIVKQTHTHFQFLFIKIYLKFLKTLLHVSVIRP